MQDFFDRFKQSAKKTTQILAEKTTKAVDITKNEVEIQKQKIELNKTYKKLGKLVYKNHYEHVLSNEDEINNICKHITNVKNTIKKHKATIENIKNDVESEEDDDIIQNEQDDNNEDYYDYKEEEVAVEDEIKPEKNSDGYYVMKFCKYCNVGNHPDAKKCINCGKEF